MLERFDVPSVLRTEAKYVHVFTQLVKNPYDEASGVREQPCTSGNDLSISDLRVACDPVADHFRDDRAPYTSEYLQPDPV